MGVIIFIVAVYFIYKRLKERVLPFYRSDEYWVNMKVKAIKKKKKEWYKMYIPLLLFFGVLSPFLLPPFIIIIGYAVVSKIDIERELKKAMRYQKRAENDPELRALISEDFGSTPIEEIAKRQRRREGEIIEEDPPPKKEKTEWKIIQEFEKKYKEEERSNN